MPLMAIVQQTKHKAWPVVDCQKLNDHVTCHTSGEVTDIYVS